MNAEIKRITDLEKQAADALAEREACHKLFADILIVCGQPQQGYPGVVECVKGLKSRLERELQDVCDEWRRLNDVHAKALNDNYVKVDALKFELNKLEQQRDTASQDGRLASEHARKTLETAQQWRQAFQDMDAQRQQAEDELEHMQKIVNAQAEVVARVNVLMLDGKLRMDLPATEKPHAPAE